MAAPYKMKGSPMYRNYGIGSPAKQTHGSGTDWEHTHKEKVAHSDGAAAHNKKSKKRVEDKPTKAAYGNKDQGGGVQTYEEYVGEINASL